MVVRWVLYVIFYSLRLTIKGVNFCCCIFKSFNSGGQSDKGKKNFLLIIHVYIEFVVFYVNICLFSIYLIF